jgi:outer membrane lipoprotein-sorting protein
MVTKDRAGTERTLEAEMFWQKDPETDLSNVLLTFDSPPELRGAALLVLGRKPQNDMFMYLPELGKPRRITESMVSGNLLGTDFTYDDFSRLQGMISNRQTERLADEQVAGRAAYVTLARPISGSDYDRIRSLIDRETCVPLRIEFYEKGGQEPVKLLTVDPAKVSEEKSHWIPRELQLANERDGTSTQVVIEKVELSVPINRKCFSVVELERQGGCQVLPRY